MPSIALQAERTAGSENIRNCRSLHAKQGTHLSGLEATVQRFLVMLDGCQGLVMHDDIAVLLWVVDALGELDLVELQRLCDHLALQDCYLGRSEEAERRRGREMRQTLLQVR